MKIDIVSYQRNYTKFGFILCYVGLFFLLLNIIPFLRENYSTLIVVTSMAIILLGFGIINFYSDNIIIEGYIIFDKYTTKIIRNESIKNLKNNDYNVRFSNSGYKGMSNYIPFLRLGAMSTNAGINTVYFYNENEKDKHEILITSAFDFFALKQLLSTNFRNYEEI